MAEKAVEQRFKYRTINALRNPPRRKARVKARGRKSEDGELEERKYGCTEAQ